MVTELRRFNGHSINLVISCRSSGYRAIGSFNGYSKNRVYKLGSMLIIDCSSLRKFKKKKNHCSGLR
jgi:hypothetical protein